MNLSTYLRHGMVLKAPPETKDEVLRTIAREAGKDPRLAPFDEPDLARALADREAIGTTGFGNGVALPHCHLDGLEEFVAGAVAVPSGVAFDAVDGKPVTLLLYIFAPSHRRNEHVALLSAISRIVRSPENVAALSAAASGADLLERLLRHRAPTSGKQEEKILLQVFIQREELFEEVLEELSRCASGSVVVLEGRDAGSYLQRMPLFAGFWTEKPEHFLRVLVALVDKSLGNDTTRRVMSVCTSGNPGLMVVGQDLALSAGSLEFFS